VRVADIRSGLNSSSPKNLVNVNSTLYFTANNGSSGEELWKSNGTAATTGIVKAIAPGSLSAVSSPSRPPYFANLNGTLYFAANDGTNGIDLWKSDGTDAGTVRLFDVSPKWLTVVGNQIFFVGSDSTNGSELWATDGTAVGTRLVKNIAPSTTNA